MLPAVVENAIKPKPTKREIIEAMARLHIEKLRKENDENKARRDEMDEQIEKMLKAHIRRRGMTCFETSAYFHHYGEDIRGSVTINFKAEDLSEPIIAKMKERKAIPEHFCVPTIEKARREIAARMNGIAPTNERVDALLASPDSRKALESALQSLE